MKLPGLLVIRVQIQNLSNGYSARKICQKLKVKPGEIFTKIKIRIKNLLTFNMERIYSSLVCISICFTAVQLFEYETKTQINFLRDEILSTRCWKNEDVLSRQVLIAGQKTSIIDFLQVSKLSQRQWSVDKHNVVELYLLINTLFSCEYCDFINYYTQYLHKKFDECCQISSSGTFQNKSDRLFELVQCVKEALIDLRMFLRYISTFIFTLTAFKENRKEDQFSNSDDLKILLSWYLHMRSLENTYLFPGKFKPITENNSVENKLNVVYKLIDIYEMLKNQFLIVLKEFDITNCRQYEESLNFNKSILNSTSSDLKKIIKPKLKLYTEMNRFESNLVINLEDKHCQLLNIINRNTNLKVH